MSQIPASRQPLGGDGDQPRDWRIAEIRVYRHELVVAGGYAMGHSELATADSTLIEVVTEDGIKKTGSSDTARRARWAPSISPTTHSVHARHWPSSRPCCLAKMLRNLAKAHQDAVLMGHEYAKAAVDLALWDLLGKACKLRVCDLIGGALTDRVPS